MNAVFDQSFDRGSAEGGQLEGPLTALVSNQLEGPLTALVSNQLEGPLTVFVRNQLEWPLTAPSRLSELKSGRGVGGLRSRTIGSITAPCRQWERRWGGGGCVARSGHLVAREARSARPQVPPPLRRSLWPLCRGSVKGFAASREPPRIGLAIGELNVRSPRLQYR